MKWLLRHGRDLDRIEDFLSKFLLVCPNEPQTLSGVDSHYFWYSGILVWLFFGLFHSFEAIFGCFLGTSGHMIEILSPICPDA